MKDKNVLMVTGGSVNTSVLKEYASSGEYNYIVGVDKGLEALDEVDIKPDIAIGDFDSANSHIKLLYEKDSSAIILKPEKDYTDTHAAILEVLKLKPRRIKILGATGTRIDHMLGNLAILKLCILDGAECVIEDDHNRIRLIDREAVISRDDHFGKYVSLIPYTDKVTGVCIRGLKYELEDACLIKEETIGISNELGKEDGYISIKSGLLFIMETRD